MAAVRKTTFALLVLVSISSWGCEAKAVAPLRIGINPWPGYEHFYLAQELGYFEQEGVAVRIVEYPSLGDVRRAFERGQIDGMGCTVVELIQARRGGRQDPKAVLVTDYSNGGDVIVAQDRIADLNDLRGHRVGVELGSLNIFLLARALEIRGASLDDVICVPVAQADMPSALAQGRCDAVVTYPLYLTEIERRGGVRRLFTSAEIPGEVLDLMVVEGRAIRERPEDVSAMIRAFDRARNEARRRPDEPARIMAQREGLTVAEFLSCLASEIRLVEVDEQEPFLEPGGQLERVLRDVVRVLEQTGQTRVAPLTGNEIDPEPVRRARSERGR
ncbi:MAG: ABC transporter substrate-binding protein [Planctomycetes bacterium]|nr:ABC transporter substrate-binding protein [Planctomycetota bacterium]